MLAVASVAETLANVTNACMPSWQHVPSGYSRRKFLSIDLPQAIVIEGLRFVTSVAFSGSTAEHSRQHTYTARQTVYPNYVYGGKSVLDECSSLSGLSQVECYLVHHRFNTPFIVHCLTPRIGCPSGPRTIRRSDCNYM